MRPYERLIMQSVFNFTIIEFDLRDWENGFFVSFKIPFSRDNYEAVVGLRNSANIKLIK